MNITTYRRFLPEYGEMFTVIETATPDYQEYKVLPADIYNAVSDHEKIYIINAVTRFCKRY